MNVLLERIPLAMLCTFHSRWVHIVDATVDVPVKRDSDLTAVLAPEKL